MRFSHRIKQIWQVGKSEYLKLIFDPRVVIVPTVLIFGYQFATVPLLENAAMMEEKINYLEPFIAMMNSNMMSLIVPAVFLTLMSDFPRFDGNTLFVVKRVGKGNWLWGQVVYFLLSITTYLLVILFGSIVPVLGKGRWGAEWSETVLDFGRMFPELSQNAGTRSIPPELYYHMSPGYAAVMGSVLMSLYLFFLLAILLLVSILGRKNLGIILDMVIAAAGTGFCAVNSKYRFIFPMAHSLLRAHYTQFFREIVFPVTGSLIYFVVGICVLFAASVSFNHRRNFMNQEEMD